MIWLLVGLALAAPLRLTPSPGAVTEVLPVTVPGKVEVVIHGNTVDLRPQIPDGALDGIRAWRLLDMGNVWLLTLTMRERDASIAFAQVGDTLTASLALPNTPAVPAQICDTKPRSPLVPLHGRDMLSDFSVAEVTPVLPRWSEAEPGDASWGRVAGLRLRLAPKDAKTYYQLGALHRDLGHAREAIYYFSTAVGLGAPTSITVLQRAGAQLAVHDWVGAGASAAEARKVGDADEETLTQIEGIVALMTNSADPALTGHAVALASGKARSSLVAGELLMRGGCVEDAATVLRQAAQDPEPGVATMALRLLLDAQILLGNVSGADNTLNALTTRVTPARWAPLLRSRSSLLNLLRQSPDAWAVMVPTLERVGRGEGDEADESLFLLGQICETLGDHRLALYAWTTLADRDRHMLAGEPGLRLARAWQSRIRSLLTGGHDLDALSVHEGVWRPGLVAHIVDPSPLYDLAAAAERLDMYEPALDLMRTASEVEGRQLLDDRASILTIARLYRLNGRTPEAEQSLDLLATRPPDPTIGAGMTLLRAAIQEDARDDDAAAALLATVVAPPAQAAEALVRRAMIDARRGRCAEALLVFAAAPDPFPPAVSRAEMVEDEARCLMETGRPDDAKAVAAEARKQLVDPDAIGLADWTSGAPTVAGDVWSRLRAEEEAQTTFDARVSTSRGEKRSSPGAFAR